MLDFRHFSIIIIGLWCLGCGAIIIAQMLAPTHPCHQPIALNYVTADGNQQTIVDVWQGVKFQQLHHDELNNQLSPNGRYEIILPDSGLSQASISIRDYQTNHYRNIYTTPNTSFAEWSYDSQALFILETHSDNENYGNPIRFFRINIDSLAITHEYPLPQTLADFSPLPDRRFIYSSAQDLHGNFQTISIDTITGDLTDFVISPKVHLGQSSPDNQWIAINKSPDANNTLSIVNAETGDDHPLVAPFEGKIWAWTDNSLWISVAGTSQLDTSIFQISLADGSSNFVYDNVASLTVSSADRWRIIGINNGVENRVFHLHDAVTNTLYDDFNVVQYDIANNEKCMIVTEGDLTDPDNIEIIIYDMERYTPIYRQPFNSLSDSTSNILDWYEVD